MGKGKRKGGLVTEASSRKARRKEQRQLKKQRRARSASFDSAGGRRRSESGETMAQMMKPKSTATNSKGSAEPSKTKKKKRSLSIDKTGPVRSNGDPYAHLDPAVAAQLRADDSEIQEMERMLGFGGGGGAKTAEERKRLNKEYEKLEGYGSDFGEFLYGLDGLAERLGSGSGGDDDDDDHFDSEHKEQDDFSKDSDASDMSEQYDSGEDEIVPKKKKKTSEEKSPKKEKKNKKSKRKEASSASSDPYAQMDAETAAALRAEDAEIAALEDKLGIKAGKKERKKLNKEFATEGYDASFGDWLYGLDDMVGRLAGGKDDYDDAEFSADDSSAVDDGSSDGEGMLPMKDPAMSEEEEDFDDDFHAHYAAASKGRNEEEQSSSTSGSDADESDDGANQSSSDSESSGSDNSDDSSEEESSVQPDHDAKFTYRPSAGEDIYGNKRDDDNDSSQKPSKYVPPHLRKKLAQVQSKEGASSSKENTKDRISDKDKKDEDDPDRQESLLSIKRSLNNVLNRLSDQMLESVSKSISGLYRSNPVNDVNECFLANIKNACVPSNLVISGLIPIYIACASGVHVQTGDDVQLGGYLLEHIVLELLDELEDARNAREDDNAVTEYDDDMARDESVLSNKRACNLALILCYLYNYNIVHCSLMYDLIRELIENFSEMDVEVLLLILSHCGYQLRSDDPTALKDIVLLVQDRALRAMDDNEDGRSVRLASSSRVQYMIGAMTDLKNNKRRKKDEMVGQKTASYRKTVGRIKSTSVNNSFGRSSDASMRIKLQDVKDIETKGRWWKVGAKWRGNQFHDDDDATTGASDAANAINSTSKSQSASEKEEHALLVLASKYRMNTDLRRSIFCIIMGSMDCEDAFEKLVRGGMLKGKAERDVIRVLIECCSQEKSYNPYYAHLANRICEYQPSCNFTLRLTYWDAFKQFDSMKDRKAANLAKLLAHLVCNGRGLNLNVLKVIEIDNDGMSEKAIIFLMVLFTTLLETFDDPLQVTGLFEAAFASSKKKRKRSMGDEEDLPDDDGDGLKESLLLFLLQYMKASPKNVKKSQFRTNYKAAVKACETNGLDMMM